MAKMRYPKFVDWLVCVGAFALGVGLLCLYQFGQTSGTTPEDELTLAEGVASDATIKQSEGGRGPETASISFSIGGHRTEYSSDRPKYPELFSAITRGQRLSVWVSTKQETLIRRQNWVPLYKFNIGDTPVLTYAEMVAHKDERARPILIVGCVITAIGLWMTWLLVRTREQYIAAAIAAAEGRPLDGAAEQAEDPAKKVMKGTVILSLITYAVIMGVVCDSQVRSKWVEAFGAKPFGMPVVVVVSLAQTLLYIPMPWVFWHAMRIIFQGIQDGRVARLEYFMTVGSRHPDLRRSQKFCFAGALYFLAIVATWIAYAAYRGI